MQGKFKSELVGKKEITQDIYEFELKVIDTQFHFKAGQYVWIILPKLNYEDPKGDQRAFSITSSPSSNKSFSVIFRKTESGYVKTALELPLGIQVEIMGPFGFFTLPEETRPLVFLAGGTGIAPFLSMIAYAGDNKLPNNITLIVANTTERQQIHDDMLKKYAADNPAFVYKNITGGITEEVIKEIINKQTNNLWYISGGQEMVFHTATILKKHGIREDEVLFNGYYGYGIKDGNSDIMQTLIKKDIDTSEFKLAVEGSSEHIIITDIGGIIRYANEAAEKITGYAVAEMIGNTPRLWGGLMEKDYYIKLWKTIKFDQKIFEGKLINHKKNGQVYTSSCRIAPIKNESGELIAFISHEDDITKELEIEKMKDEFVSVVSHELRTPMTAIKGIISMIFEGDYGSMNENLKKPLKDVAKSTERLIRLVNDMLNVSQIESGRLKYNLSEFTLDSLLKDIVVVMKPLAQQKQIELIVEIPDGIFVQADYDKTGQIVSNLIGNAIKFTDRGAIRVTPRQDKENVNVFVEDSGIGITNDGSKKLFGKFQQILTNQSGRPSGSGLGLYISHQLAQKMGGNLWLEKSEPGKGSVFAFSLPLIKTKTATMVKKIIYAENEKINETRVL